MTTIDTSIDTTADTATGAHPARRVVAVGMLGCAAAIAFGLAAHGAAAAGLDHAAATRVVADRTTVHTTPAKDCRIGITLSAVHAGDRLALQEYFPPTHKWSDLGSMALQRTAHQHRTIDVGEVGSGRYVVRFAVERGGSVVATTKRITIVSSGSQPTPPPPPGGNPPPPASIPAPMGHNLP